MCIPKEEIRIEALDALCSQVTEPDTYPLAAEIVKNIVVYDGVRLRTLLQGVARCWGH